MKKTLKALWAWIQFIFTLSGPLARESVEEGICNFGGQGRDEFGKTGG